VAPLLGSPHREASFGMPRAWEFRHGRLLGAFRNPKPRFIPPAAGTPRRPDGSSVGALRRYLERSELDLNAAPFCPAVTLPDSRPPQSAAPTPPTARASGLQACARVPCPKHRGGTQGLADLSSLVAEAASNPAINISCRARKPAKSSGVVHHGTAPCSWKASAKSGLVKACRVS
jgi:hypothetical protein